MCVWVWLWLWLCGCVGMHESSGSAQSYSPSPSASRKSRASDASRNSHDSLEPHCSIDPDAAAHEQVRALSYILPEAPARRAAGRDEKIHYRQTAAGSSRTKTGGSQRQVANVGRVETPEEVARATVSIGEIQLVKYGLSDAFPEG